VLQPDSLLNFVFPSDPQVSPDGRSVAFVLTRIEEENPEKPEADDPKPRYKSAIYLSDGSEPRQITAGVKRDSSPRWSPDGRSLAFLSDRDGKTQLFLLPLSAGEPRKLTRFKAGVSDVRWSPDGRTLAFLSRGDWEDLGPERGEPRVVDRLRYKFNGSGFLPAEPRSIYALDVGTGGITRVFRPEVEPSDYVWKPDGSGFLIVSAKSERDAALWQEEVFDVTLDGTVRQVTDWGAPIAGIAPHPDGTRFVGVGRPSTKTNVEDAHVYEFRMDGTWRRLDEHVDHPVGNSVAGDCHVGSMPSRPVWRGDTVAVQYTVGGACGVFELQEGRANPVEFNPSEVIPGFTLNANGTAFIRENEHTFPEVFLNGQQITALGDALDDFPRRKAQRVTGISPDGTEVEGWMLHPGTDGAPVLLTIHGGPHTAYGHGFMHEFQLFAERGYAVCYCNPRGSQGYGQAFTESIFGRWGSIDMQDILAFLDACLERHPELNRDRTGVMGGSYGGYMTNWIISHTDRFKAAVTDRSICNLVSFNGTADIGPRFWRDELGLEFVNPEDIQRLWDMSPLKYVRDVRTPTLIVHSEEDHRCPVEQAEQWFTALRLLGVEARFVRFPEENHELSRSGRPDRRVRRLNEYLSWLDGHLRA